MNHFLQELLDWSEVWALLIPIIALLKLKPHVNWLKPVRVYLFLAFLINLIANILWKRIRLDIEGWMQSNLSFFYNTDGSLNNTILYNFHSISRFILFAWFFSYLGSQFKKLNSIIPLLFLFTVGFVFIFYKDIREFSSFLLATEAALLLVYCLVYYFLILRDETSNIKQLPPFWVVTGLSIYVVINFPIFLFYTLLATQSEKFAVNIWDIHNISYVIFCLLITKSFYAAKQQY